MEDITKKVQQYSSDEEIIGAYDGEWHRSEIERLGKLRAEKEGINQEKVNIAKKMLKANSDINFISEITGLSNEEIKKLVI